MTRDPDSIASRVRSACADMLGRGIDPTTELLLCRFPDVNPRSLRAPMNDYLRAVALGRPPVVEPEAEAPETCAGELPWETEEAQRRIDGRIRAAQKVFRKREIQGRPRDPVVGVGVLHGNIARFMMRKEKHRWSF